MENQTTTIVIAIVSTGAAILGIGGVMIRMLWSSVTQKLQAMNKSMGRQFDTLGREFTTVHGRLQHLETRIDETNGRIDETNRRIDTIGRDIADLRDRTGTLEGTLSTFMNAGRSPNAA